MARTSLINKQQRKPKYSTRAYTRCQFCGRARAVYQPEHQHEAHQQCAPCEGGRVAPRWLQGRQCRLRARLRGMLP